MWARQICISRTANWPSLTGPQKISRINPKPILFWMRLHRSIIPLLLSLQRKSWQKLKISLTASDPISGPKKQRNGGDGYEELKKVKLLNSMAAMNIRLVLVLQENGSFIINEYENKKFRDLPGISEDTFGICFTSGSTSQPKGIVLSNSAITGNALAVAQHLGFSSEERTIIPRSLAQASPISGDVPMDISRGGRSILLNNVFHPAIFLKAVQEYRATNFYIVRTMLPQILEYSQLKNYDLSSVRRILIGGMVNPLTIDSQFERFKYAVENKEPSKWQFDLFTRLFDVNRILSIDKSKAEGMNRFIDAKFG